MIALASCGRDDGKLSLPAPKPAQPVRVAAEDHDLRVMLAELAAAKACTMIRGQYRPLRAMDRPGVVTGTLWIRGCEITQHGTKVTFRLKGQGWQWADEKKSKAGATFAVRQYVRFDVDAKIPGTLDIAYGQKTHVLSLWFSPAKLPDVTFTPTGEIDVDPQGTWSSVVGALGSLVAHSPSSMAKAEAEAQGEREFAKQWADGLSVTVDLCKGLPRINLGRPEQGKMLPADVGETTKVPAELYPGGVMAFGPYFAPHGMTVRAHVRSGRARFEVACADDAALLTDAFTTGGDPAFAMKRLGVKDLGGDGTLKVKGARCPVVVIARPLGDEVVTFDWTRPESEAAAAVGGPLIDC